MHGTRFWPRYRPSDFRKGAEHGLAPDWPIAYEDLAPFYDAVDRIVGTSGLAGDLASPPRPGYATSPLPLRPVGRRLAEGFDRLGWHWWPMPAGEGTGSFSLENSTFTVVGRSMSGM
jgi:choline dehydrogenase-like flavoprotein